MELDFGKKITEESYFDGKMTKRQVTYSVPVLIKNKSEALNEILKAIDLIISKQTATVSVTITADKDHQLKLLTTEYVVDTTNS